VAIIGGEGGGGGGGAWCSWLRTHCLDAKQTAVTNL
jgi:hypothetical protein